MLREIPLWRARALASPLLPCVAPGVRHRGSARQARLGGSYRLLWHPSLARFGLFLCLFSAPRAFDLISWCSDEKS